MTKLGKMQAKAAQKANKKVLRKKVKSPLMRRLQKDFILSLITELPPITELSHQHRDQNSLLSRVITLSREHYQEHYQE